MSLDAVRGYAAALGCAIADISPRWAAELEGSAGHERTLSPPAQRIADRLTALESAGLAQPALWQALEAVLALALPAPGLAPSDPRLAETRDFAPPPPTRPPEKARR